MANTLTGNAATVAAFLKGHGLTDAQVAGIMGNWQVESGFSPTATGDGGLAYGLAQWHPDRRPAGGLSSDISQQLDWFWTEAHSSESGSFNNFLAHSSTPEQAAASFDQFYERSDGTSRATREADADGFYPEIAGVSGDISPNSGGGVSGLKNIPVVGSVVNGAEDTASALGSIGSFFSWFTDVNHLLRVGYFIVGAALVLVGGAKLVGTSVPGPIGKMI